MGMENFLEELEKRSLDTPLFEESDAMSVVQGASGDWWYVPKDAYFNGLVRVAIHEASADNWEIYYCAIGARSAMANPDATEVQLDHMINQVAMGKGLNEEVEGDVQALKGWAVKSQWAGNFGECLKKCVAIVQGKAAEGGVDVAQFKKA